MKQKKNPGTFFFFDAENFTLPRTYLTLDSHWGRGYPLFNTPIFYQSNGVTYGQISKPAFTTFRKPPSWSSRVDFVEVLSTYPDHLSPTAREMR